MLISIIPGFGGFAYLITKPLRRGILIRLMIDRIGRKIPGRLYSRTRLDRLIAPRRRPATEADKAIAGSAAVEGDSQSHDIQRQ